jgi:hypothetical protein
MSTQLIIFPQSFNGQFNSISNSPSEYAVNGLNFLGLNNTISFDAASVTPVLQALTSSPPTTINTWFRFRSTLTGTPALPIVTSNDAVLSSATTQSKSGIYQRLSNLTVGQQYTFRINLGTTGAGNVVLAVYDGGVFNSNLFTPATTTTTINHYFTATSANDTIMIYYDNTTNDTISIKNVSVFPTGTTPPGYLVESGEVICDLYEDEDIPLTLSVDDFKNAAEQVQSYSKAFNLPATKRNNQIFDNVFEITRSAQGNLQFNPYAKTQCTLKQDGLVLFQGYLRLINIQDKEGEISYDVNLYSEVIALVDVLEGMTFSDLDFSELNHNYDYTEIKNSWQGILTVAALPIDSFANNTGVAGATTTNVLKYPFVDWEHNYTVGINTGMPVLPNLESSFRPFIRIKYLIQRIFNQTNFPFTYTSDFIDNDVNFQKLFMDFNWGDGRVPVTFDDTGGLALGDRLQQIPDSYDEVLFQELSSISNNSPNTTLPASFGYDESTGIFTATTDNQEYIIDYNIYLGQQTTTTVAWSARWVVGVSGVFTGIEQATGSSTGPASDNYSGSFSVILQTGDTLRMQVEEGAGVNLVVWNNTNTTDSVNDTYFFNNITVSTNAQETTSDTLLQTLRGELGQWEFLKGIMTMFNLISIPDKSNPNNILIEPYGDVFINNTNSGDINDLTLASRSIAHDWTEKIDVTEMKLTPLTDLDKMTIFKFVEDDDDYAFNLYKQSVQQHLYGSKKYDASLTTGGFQSVLDGETEIIAEPFAATVPKPLMSQFSELITPAIYSYNPDDGTSEAFDNAPRIMIEVGIKTLSTLTYGVPAQNGVAGNVAEDDYLQFSHLSTTPTTNATFDFHFGECQLISPIGNPTPLNLFNLYWLPYFAELYDPDTRTMSIKVNLTAADIATFNMYDTVFIKNRQFRVNKIDYKPNDLATVEFILIP